MGVQDQDEEREPEPSRRISSFLRGLARGMVTIGVLLAVIWFWRTWEPEAFMEWRRDAGPVPFFIALAILPGIGFPTTPFYILAGATFSPWVNVVGVSLSLAAHVIISYWVAHSWMRRLLERLLRGRRRQLPTLDHRRAVRFALLVKIAPGVPTFMKTYMIGMSGISFPAHFIICFTVTGCYAAAFVILGESLVERDTGGGLVGAALLGAIVGVLYLIRRKLKADRDPAADPIESAAEQSRSSW